MPHPDKNDNTASGQPEYVDVQREVLLNLTIYFPSIVSKEEKFTSVLVKMKYTQRCLSIESTHAYDKIIPCLISRYFRERKRETIALSYVYTINCQFSNHISLVESMRTGPTLSERMFAIEIRCTLQHKDMESLMRT